MVARQAQSDDGARRGREASEPRVLDADKQFAGYDSAIVSRFMRYVTPYKRGVVLSVIGVLLFTFSTLAIPLVIRAAVDNALVPEGNPGLLPYMVAGLIVLALINYASNYMQEMVISRVAQRVLYDIRKQMFQHLQNVSLSFTDRTEIGRVISRVQGDVGALQEFLETTVHSIGDFLLLGGIIVVLLVVDWQLGLLTLGVVPALFLVRIIWLPFARNAFLRSRQALAIVNGALNENVSGVRVVQGMTREETNYRLFNEKVQYALDENVTAARFSAMLMPVVDILTGVAMAVVVIVGGAMVLNDPLRLGTMILFLIYIQRFFDPIRNLTMHYNVLQRAMAAGQRIFELLDMPIEVQDKPDGTVLKGIDGSIEFKNVTFGYVPNRPILNDITFRVNPGETVALVGPTGSGKTSITALAHRFYDVWEGTVLVGGHDVRDVTQASLGRHVSMVLQDPFLFSDNVLENIRYRKRDATRTDIVNAARAVGAHDFIMKLPDGYDTLLEQRGSNLSLGQRQLLSFARAIVADSKILVLDEATANIDSYTELLIQRALGRLLEGRTGLVIAHRLATIRGADRIIVLEGGRIVEQGNHPELLARGGLYARLYSLNYASFDDIPEELVQAAKSGIASAAAT